MKRFFRDLGYQVTNHQEFEPNFRKIAIYVDRNGMPEHVARQITSDPDIGCWTSKCGSSHDVIHEFLEDLEGKIYGSVARIMKKRIL